MNIIVFAIFGYLCIIIVRMHNLYISVTDSNNFMISANVYLFLCYILVLYECCREYVDDNSNKYIKDYDKSKKYIKDYDKLKKNINEYDKSVSYSNIVLALYYIVNFFIPVIDSNYNFIALLAHIVLIKNNILSPIGYILNIFLYVSIVYNHLFVNRDKTIINNMNMVGCLFIIFFYILKCVQ